MKDFLKRSSGGTGFPACADHLAGGDARPTNFSSFMSNQRNRRAVPALLQLKRRARRPSYLAER